MEFEQVIERRHTTRDFADTPLELSQIKKILSAGLKAPSWDHQRGWEFIVLTEKEAMDEICKHIQPVPCNITEPQTPQQEMMKIAFPRQQSMLNKAGCIVFPLFKQSGNLFHAENIFALNAFAAAWCVIENIFLAATNEGLACSMHIPTGKEPDAIKEALQYPNDYVMPCVIGIGYPAENAEYPTQVQCSIEDKLHPNKW